MRDELTAAADELSRLERDLKCAGRDDPVEALVRLASLGRLLLGSGPVGAATAAVVHESSLNVSAIHEQAMHRVVSVVKGQTRELFNDLHRLDTLILDQGPDSAVRRSVAWRGETQPMASVLSQLRRERPDGWKGLNLADASVLANSVFPALYSALVVSADMSGAVAVAQAKLSEMQARAREVEANIVAVLGAANRAVRVAELADHRNAFVAIQELCGAVDGLRRLEPAVDFDAFKRADANLPDLLPCCERLVSDVRARLLAGPERSLVINRLVLHLERFETSLLDAMQSSARPEQIAQHSLDRYLFGQNFWPITHAVAGQGRIDTFIEPSGAIPEEALGMRCS